MKKLLFLTVAALLTSAPAFASSAATAGASIIPSLAVTDGIPADVLAQSPSVPQVYVAQHLNWNQSGPDLATVQGFTYQVEPDGDATKIAPLASATCAGTASPFACSAPMPAFTPGSHSLKLITSNIAGASPDATNPTIAFTFVVAPDSATNLTIK